MRTVLPKIALTALLVSVSSASWAAGLFGMLEIRAPTIDSIQIWVVALGRINTENLQGKCAAGQCDNRQEEWYQMVQDLRGKGRFEQMVGVHRWLNRYKYITDDRLWGKSDFWETPGQFVEMSGDCEDYSIAKYYTLRVLGWRDEDLRLVVLRDTIRDIPHAVLAVNYDGENYILDNLASEPLQDRYLKQYTPYYAVNSTTRWVFIQPIQ
jgi:predicted transglutaminase-like cysteine proteinase